MREERDVNQQEWLARQFEEQRPHLRAVAYRMLGSLSEADDAVQDAWLRLSRADTSEVENLRAWLTTVVARVALNLLRARNTRREQPLDVRVPDPIIDPADGTIPSTRRCSPTRSAWRSSSCSRRSRRPNVWRSSSTTCSPCRSRRSPPSLSVHPRRRANSPAARAAASAAPPPFQIPT